jgi:cytochrome c
MKQLVKLTPVIAALFLFGCGSGNDTEKSDNTSDAAVQSMIEDEPDPMESIGIGPITSVTLDAEVNTELAAAGETVFKEKCTACHKADKKHIGPAPKGIMERRSPEWIMNMILNPEEMVLNDPTARNLLMEFNGSPMANQNLTEEEARSVLEYFRTLN